MADFGDEAAKAEAFFHDAAMLAGRPVTAGAGTLICVDCGDDIPPARKEALPNSRRCVICQEEAER